MCRVTQRLGRLLAIEPVSRPAATIRFSANVQFIVDADTLVIAAARPTPGTTADAHAWRASGLAERKTLRDCRQHGDGFHHAVQAVAHMRNVALTSRPEDCGHGP